MCVPLMCRSIVGIEFERLSELSLAPDKIPFVNNLVEA